jgi:hypothetical protein
MNFIKYVLLTLGIVLLGACSQPDSAMKTAYIEDCSSDGFSAEKCSCIFDFAEERLTEDQLLASDLTHAYRQSNGIPEADITIAQMEEVGEAAMNSMAACL